MPSHVSKFIKRSGLRIYDASKDRQKLIALKPPEDVLVRFLSHVDQCERVDLCWNWKGSRSYGRFDGWLAHRWIWSLLFGPIPPDHVIHHSCENTLCQNPVHLKCMRNGEHLALHRQNSLCQ